MKNLGLAVLISFIVVSGMVCPKVRANESEPGKKLTLEDVGPREDWQTFKNTRNGFEFMKPQCLGFQNRDPENEPSESNVVTIVQQGKCKNGVNSEIVLEISSLNTPPIDFKRILANKENIYRKEINLNGSPGVITAKRSNKENCANWRVYTQCNSKNLSIEFSECLGKKEFGDLSRGVGQIEPVKKAIIESFNCLVK